MQLVEHSYIQARDGNYYVGDTRITVRSVVSEWLQGLSAEEITRDFPGLSLAQVYGTVAQYLDHQQEFDAFFRDAARRASELRAEVEASDPAFYAALRQRFAAERARRSQEAGEAQGDPGGPAL